MLVPKLTEYTLDELHAYCIRLARLTFGVLAVFAVIMVFFGAVGSYLFRQNHNRINDIQQSRILACEAIYRSFNTVFLPFFPPPGKRTKLQDHNLAILNAIISSKVKQCPHQILNDTQ